MKTIMMSMAALLITAASFAQSVNTHVKPEKVAPGKSSDSSALQEEKTEVSPGTPVRTEIALSRGKMNMQKGATLRKASIEKNGSRHMPHNKRNGSAIRKQ